MKFALIGPGLMPIPPNGWGAVETVIYDQSFVLQSLGHDVLIVNTPSRAKAISAITSFSPDCVLIHYDNYVWWSSSLCQYPLYICSHFGYLSSFLEFRSFFSNPISGYFFHYFVRSLSTSLLNQLGIPLSFLSLSGYYPILFKFLNLSHPNCTIIALSTEIASVYLSLGSTRPVRVFHNSARSDLVSFISVPLKPNRAICLGKIEPRKRQAILQFLPCIDFVGPVADIKFNRRSSNYLGIWSRKEVFENLTHYSSLVLLSEGEAHALVCLEALFAGLGLVVTKAAAANLDTTQPFITCIDNHRLSDLAFVSRSIENNIQISLSMRDQIRDYAMNKFDAFSYIQEFYPPFVS